MVIIHTECDYNPPLTWNNPVCWLSHASLDYDKKKLIRSVHGLWEQLTGRYNLLHNNNGSMLHGTICLAVCWEHGALEYVQNTLKTCVLWLDGWDGSLQHLMCLLVIVVQSIRMLTHLSHQTQSMPSHMCMHMPHTQGENP